MAGVPGAAVPAVPAGGVGRAPRVADAAAAARRPRRQQCVMMLFFTLNYVILCAFSAHKKKAIFIIK